MQVAGDPDPLRLLGGQHPTAILMPFALEAIEHVVEGGHDAADLVAPADRKALPGPQQVNGVHAPRKPLEWHDRTSQQGCVRRERDREATDDHQRLRCPDRRIDLDRAHEQKHRDPAEESRVDGEDTREER